MKYIPKIIFLNKSNIYYLVSFSNKITYCNVSININTILRTPDDCYCLIGHRLKVHSFNRGLPAARNKLVLNMTVPTLDDSYWLISGSYQRRVSRTSTDRPAVFIVELVFPPFRLYC